MREKCARAEEDARGQGEYFSSLLSAEALSWLFRFTLLCEQMKPRRIADQKLVVRWKLDPW